MNGEPWNTAVGVTGVPEKVDVTEPCGVYVPEAENETSLIVGVSVVAVPENVNNAPLPVKDGVTEVLKFSACPVNVEVMVPLGV